MDSGTNSWFQAPVSGYYSISIQLANALASWAADSYFAAGIYVNAATGGTQTWTLGEWVSQDAPATSTYSNLAATRVIKLNAGDYVNIAYINGAGVALSLDAQAIDCWLNITRVG